MITNEDLELVMEIMNRAQVNPVEYWAKVGYDLEVVLKVATAGAMGALAQGIDVPPEFVVAMMQGGAALALGALNHGTSQTGIEI